MNKVITINLNGNACQLEEAGYEALRAYLDAAARALEENPDREEIIADIEQAIADKCRASLGAYRTVVSAKDLVAIIAAMGPVDGGAAPSDEKKPDPATTGPQPSDRGTAPQTPPRRLYRIHDGALISGVCNGLAAYFNVDVTLVRLVFLVLTFLTGGILALAYLAMIFIIPAASTPAETTAAFGGPSTAREFIRRAREGYYEGMKSFHDRHARREWKRRFRQEMRDWRHTFHHEMGTASRRWQTQWQSNWTSHPAAFRGLWFTVSFLALLRAVLTVLWIFALLSLLSTGAIFGLALPAGLPLWAAVLILCLVFVILTAPLRASRHVLWRHGWGGGPPCAPAFLGPWDSLVWLGAIILFVWLIDRHVPHAHEALKNLPHEIQRGIDAVKHWWAQQ